MRTIVLANARVVTCDERNTIAGAVAIRDGRLMAVGDRDMVRAAGPQAQLVDLGGRAMIPGLIDTYLDQLEALGRRPLGTDRRL